jgi:hypothetical protein
MRPSLRGVTSLQTPLMIEDLRPRIPEAKITVGVSGCEHAQLVVHCSGANSQ